LLSLLALLPSLAGAETLLEYDFSDGSETEVTDLSKNGNHGELIGFSDTSAAVGVFTSSEGRWYRWSGRPTQRF
jgi:hypothetical protein